MNYSHLQGGMPQTNEEQVRSKLLQIAEQYGFTDDTNLFVESAVELKSLCTNLQKTSRSLTAVNEFVIPLESQEQRKILITVLGNIGVSAWEDNGELIIDHRYDLQKLSDIGINTNLLSVTTLPVHIEEISIENKEFPTKYAAPLKDELRSVLTGKAPYSEVRANKIVSNNAEVDMYSELTKIVEEFDAGITDETDENFVKNIGILPSLSLFPRQYIFSERKIYEKRTGIEITMDEQFEMLLLAKNGDNKTMEKLLRMHTGLVLKVITEYKKNGQKIDSDDMFQEGLLGLIRAIQLYNPDSGAFSTYALIHIESRILRYIKNNNLPIHIPNGIYSERREFRKGVLSETNDGQLDPADFFAANPKFVNKQGLSDYLTTGTKKVPQDGVGLDRLERLYFINTTFGPFNEELEDVQDNSQDANPDIELTKEQLKEAMSSVLSSLTPKEERLLRLRFGIDSKDNIIYGPDTETYYTTLEEIGIMFEVSRERIRQIEAKALRKLKHPSRSKHLRSFLDRE
jgi:RNA polymerase primary sigma factor